MITIAPDISIEEVWEVEVDSDLCLWVFCDSEEDDDLLVEVAKNDGLSRRDLADWFTKPMIGQIKCWNKDITYCNEKAQSLHRWHIGGLPFDQVKAKLESAKKELIQKGFDAVIPLEFAHDLGICGADKIERIAFELLITD